MYKMMLLVQLLVLFYVLGFGYLVWVFACKEQGLVRLGGQIIAVMIKLTILVIFIVGIFFAPKMGMCPMGMGNKDMMMKKMSGKDSAKMMKMMEKMEKLQKECK